MSVSSAFTRMRIVLVTASIRPVIFGSFWSVVFTSYAFADLWSIRNISSSSSSVTGLSVAFRYSSHILSTPFASIVSIQARSLLSSTARYEL